MTQDDMAKKWPGLCFAVSKARGREYWAEASTPGPGDTEDAAFDLLDEALGAYRPAVIQACADAARARMSVMTISVEFENRIITAIENVGGTPAEEA